MRIEAIWQELEAELVAGAGGAWLSRFALPDPRNYNFLYCRINLKKRSVSRTG